MPGNNQGHGGVRRQQAPLPRLPGTMPQAGPSPLTGGIASLSRIMAGQLAPRGEAVPGLSAYEQGKLGGPASAKPAVAPAPATWALPPAKPLDFFAYLPPPHVQMWERVWAVAYNAAAPANQGQLIQSERNGGDRVVVITNIRWFASEIPPGTNGVLCDPGETLIRLRFELRGNGSSLYDAYTQLGLGAGYGTGLIGQNHDGIRPQFAVYVRPNTLLEARYLNIGGPAWITTPNEVGVHLQGWTLPIADLQRVFPSGSLF